MNTLTRRVRALERRTFPPEDKELLKVVAGIRERRRQRLEASGLQYEEDDSPRDSFRGMTLVEVLIQGRVRAEQRCRIGP